MKFLEKWTKKITKTASSTVKEEVKDTLIDLLPTIVGIAGVIVGAVLFHGAVDNGSFGNDIPDHANITITTNNYFLGDGPAEKFIENGFSWDK